jgi:hypothetical protein
MRSYGYGDEMEMEMGMMNNGGGESVDRPQCVSDAN